MKKHLLKWEIPLLCLLALCAIGGVGLLAHKACLLQAIVNQHAALLDREHYAFKKECERRQRMARLRGYSEDIVNSLSYEHIQKRKMIWLTKLPPVNTAGQSSPKAL